MFATAGWDFTQNGFALYSRTAWNGQPLKMLIKDSVIANACLFGTDLTVRAGGGKVMQVIGSPCWQVSWQAS